MYMPTSKILFEKNMQVKINKLPQITAIKLHIHNYLHNHCTYLPRKWIIVRTKAKHFGNCPLPPPSSPTDFNLQCPEMFYQKVSLSTKQMLKLHCNIQVTCALTTIKKEIFFSYIQQDKQNTVPCAYFM